MNPQVDVLIPVYNAEPYLKQCLDSIVSQDYDNIRVILINDGSKDNSWNICQEYDSKYSFIEAYTQDNAGVAETRNRLLNRITGEYFLFVDADDWIEPNMVSYLVDTVNRNNIDIAVCTTYKDNNNSSQSLGLKIWYKWTTIEKFLYHIEINGSLWNKLIKSSLIEQTRFDPEISYGEDALFLWHILQRIEKIGITDAQLYHYRMNEASISHQKFGLKKISGHKVWEKICLDTHRLWPQYIDIAETTYAIMDMWLLYYAAMSNYRFDSNIRQYQRHIRLRIFNIIRAQQIKANKKVFALGMALSYRLGGYLIRKHK